MSQKAPLTDSAQLFPQPAGHDEWLKLSLLFWMLLFVTPGSLPWLPHGFTVGTYLALGWPHSAASSSLGPLTLLKQDHFKDDPQQSVLS